MKKIQTNILPTEALHGLIHGFFHQAKSPEHPSDSSRSLIYIDVTDTSARNALYAILKREPSSYTHPVAYDRVGDVRGFTAPRHLPVVLSANLAHVDKPTLASSLAGIFSALSHTVHKYDTQITIYGEPQIEKLLSDVRNIQFKDFLEVCTPELACGDFDLKSNITVDNFVSIAIDPEFAQRIPESPGTTYTFGRDFMFMHYEDLHKVIQILRKYKKNCTLHPDLMRYYFMNVICKY
ncbi:hypothetical protein MPK70_gp245 [Erwinia phage pEa_SNUABM_33]|uniref:Uncharacterized protein n=1 Tax=Erwinia phage pEa_SNUABM_33 TaxID=2869556 RepID=A0AAE8C1U5_9CAUD|nr:hypothetical protein MPK70_gp245 [Erwinia phage pEa_SNUABM_33]QZE58121.1 hypothetical protein pEaSNUABM33_00245 [Erwinia phage pEa_SNUABM_33]